MLNKPEMHTHAFFYFRDPAFIDDVPGTHVFDHLWQGIKSAYGLPDEPPVYPDDTLAEEQDCHERFMESRTRIYVGRQKLPIPRRRVCVS